MKFFYILSFTVLTNFIFAQNINNLVPNPSFEDTLSCPDWPSQINRALGWTNVFSSPDYVNSCAPETSTPAPVSVPNNVWGNQYAATGQAYAGFGTYQENIVNTREIIGTTLKQALEIGETYYVSFKVSSADIQSNGVNAGGYAVNKIGAYFSKTSFPIIPTTGGIPNTPILPNFSHIYTDSVIHDTTNWINISGSFVANDNYDKVSLGVFYDDNNITIVRFDTINPSWSYYYLDDVYVGNDTLPIVSISENNNLKKSNQIYPNPVKNEINVLIKTLEETTLTIIDCFGKIWFKDIYHSNQVTINTSSIPFGLFFISIEGKSNHEVLKFIKQ